MLELWDGLAEEPPGQANTLGVTVLVGGVTYSGLLIPARVWARSMTQLLRNVEGGHQVRALADMFDGFATSTEAAEQPDDATRYLHLANVAIGLPEDGKRTSLLMRIRAADVTAWTVGTIGELAAFPPPATPPAPPAAARPAARPPARGSKRRS